MLLMYFIMGSTPSVSSSFFGLESSVDSSSYCCCFCSFYSSVFFLVSEGFVFWAFFASPIISLLLSETTSVCFYSLWILVFLSTCFWFFTMILGSILSSRSEARELRLLVPCWDTSITTSWDWVRFFYISASDYTTFGSTLTAFAISETRSCDGVYEELALWFD
jgi:hypothetical protein